MKRDIYRLSSFAKTKEGGNPAGVVLEADLLSENEMKQIALEVGYSETAFVMKSEKADYRVRFFTPVEEVDLCGHATIAAFNLLRDIGKITVGTYSQETKAGILSLKISGKEVFMEQNPPEYDGILDKEEIQDCFETKEIDYIADMPIQIVSTGLRDIILPVKNMETLHDLQANYKKISELSEKYNATGIHAFSLESLYKASGHCRNFAPLYGIDEESATGTANGALACYLSRYKNSNKIDNYLFEQGYSMNKPSVIKVNLNIDNGRIIEVFVGGNAIGISNKKINN